MATQRELITSIKAVVEEFDRNIALPVVNIFDTLAPTLRQIAELAHMVDLLRLTDVPERILDAFLNQISLADECITGFIVPSYPIGEEVRAGTVRPMVHRRDPANINSRRGQLLNIHRDLFQLVGAIVAQQQARFALIASAVRVEVIDSIFSDSTIWRYMPMRNLLRMEAAGGLWMVSLERLRKWSAPTMADIREGEVPPVVAKFKEDYETAVKSVGMSLSRLQHGLELKDGIEKLVALGELLRSKGIHISAKEDAERLARQLDFSSERQNAFVSSWSCKSRESMPMWSAYGDGGKGVALRSEKWKLFQGPWRVPLSLSGRIGSNHVSSLRLRDVRYLNFDEDDPMPPFEDMHLPLLKRREFEDEHEIRLIAFTKAPLCSQGFSLYCNLRNLISQIVVGPHADFDATVVELTERAPDLRGIDIVRSALPPSKGSHDR